MRHILLLLLLLLPFSTNVFAQAGAILDSCDQCPTTNCPNGCAEVEEDTGPWSNNFSLGYNQTDGNSDTSLLNLKLTSVYEEDQDIFRFEAEHSFGDNENTTNIDYSKALAEYKRLFSDLYFGSFGVTFLRDEIADVRYRVTINPSLGYFFVKNDDGFFSLEAGPSYLFEEVGGISDDYLAPRIGYRFEYQITETAKIFSNADVFFSADDGDNYLVQSEHGIETAISKGLSLTFKLRDLSLIHI